MLVVKKKSIFAVTGRETMNVNAKQLICKFCGIMIFFLFIFDKFWFPRLWLFLTILDISFLKEIDQFIDKNEELIRYPNGVLY